MTYTQFCGSFIERRGKSRRYRIVGIGEIEIRPGEKIAVHLTSGTNLLLIVVGRNPIGPRLGASGTWIDGRLVAAATKNVVWIRELFWRLVKKMSVMGDDDQRLWAAQLLLDGEKDMEALSCKPKRMVQS